MKRRVTAFAPSTVANVAVGFDVLGFTFHGTGDEVTLERKDTPGVVIDAITSAPHLPEGSDIEKISKDATLNTATVPLIAFLGDRGFRGGVRVTIKKGIAVGSGMGGSAASAVAALVAGAALIDVKATPAELLKFAVLGEQMASGAAHPDNVTPCLYGGITVTRSVTPIDVVTIPAPAGLWAVVVKPRVRLDTKTARAVLPANIPLTLHIKQSGQLAGFIAACFKSDFQLLSGSLNDFVVEPHRARLIPGFAAVKAAAIKAGALGASISGSGPAVFALMQGEAKAKIIQQAMQAAFSAAGVANDGYAAALTPEGAKVIRTE